MVRGVARYGEEIVRVSAWALVYRARTSYIRDPVHTFCTHTAIGDCTAVGRL